LSEATELTNPEYFNTGNLHQNRQLKVVFRNLRSQPIRQVIENINPILRGWVQYFSIGHASQCFSFIRNWVEAKIRRHLGKARLRRGFGWKRWDRRWFYDELGLFDDYRVRRPKAAPVG
jgi:RNA-directed DNA polymerase